MSKFFSASMLLVGVSVVCGVCMVSGCGKSSSSSTESMSGDGMMKDEAKMQGDNMMKDEGMMKEGGESKDKAMMEGEKKM